MPLTHSYFFYESMRTLALFFLQLCINIPILIAKIILL